MRTNAWKFLGIILLFLLIITGTFSGGFLLGQAYPLLNQSSLLNNFYDPDIANVDTTVPEDLDELFKPFWQAWNFVESEYVDQPVDKTLMMRGAISGMLDALGDQHTSYMDPESYRQQSAPLQGEYDGIGAWVDVTGEFLTIISPMQGSPAEAAGLLPEDQVRGVDGEDVTGMVGELVLRKILGPAGTNVTLTIYRPYEDRTFEVEITRKKIEIPSVTSEMLENKIAYVQLVNFGDKTHEDLVNQLEELLAENPTGLILDLRNNGGGYLSSAIDVASEFVNQSPIMYEEFGDGERINYNANKGGVATKIPLVVLINGGTASASEITAGAIQDYERGVLVGTQSYGKGSVQNWISLQDDQGAIRVTIARWLTPDERQINSVGLTPDYIVEITEEEMKAGVDPQLNKAIELLLKPD